MNRPGGAVQVGLPPQTDPRWYAARPASASSADDVASLALLRWWSVTTGDATGLPDASGFGAFHADFAAWWWENPERYLAVVVEDLSGARPVPVGMGWLITVPMVPAPDHRRRGGGGRAIMDEVYLLPGAAASAAETLRSRLTSLAAENGLALVSLA